MLKKTVNISFCVILFFGIFFSPKTIFAQTYISDAIPWSGYWWPYFKGGLSTGAGYYGHPSPIEKYELLTSGVKGRDLVEWYNNMYYDRSALSWEGLCPFWARASIFESYEILPSSEDNIVFRVGDKKGLLNLCHDFDISQVASAADPVNFHFWLLEYIKDKKKAFAADLSYGVEVWYYPIFKYDMTSSIAGSIESVEVKIYYADDQVFPDYMGISQKTKSYTYDLFLDAQQEILGGEWTGNSLYDHPEIMEAPIVARGKCPYIDCDEVRKIAKSSDDSFETWHDNPTPILPGTYHLVLLNKDQYIIDGDPGDEVFINLIKEEGSLVSLHAVLLDNSGTQIYSQSLASEENLNYRLSMESPPYTIVLTQDDYHDPNIYTLSIDMLQAFRRDVPYIPKKGQWSGFVLTNTGDEMVEDVMLVTRKQDGSPLQTVFGPVNFSPGEKRVLMYDDLPIRLHESPETVALTMLSKQPLHLLNLFGNVGEPMAGFAPKEVYGSHLVIPDTFKERLVARQMNGAVLNDSFDEAALVVRIFSAKGDLQKEIPWALPAGGTKAISPGSIPFGRTPDGGWIDILSADGTQIFGYQYLAKQYGTRNSVDTMFALPVGETVKIVPHITPLLGWWKTYLTLINPNDTQNTISLHLQAAGANRIDDLTFEFEPNEKRVLDLSSEFNKISDDFSFQSILEISGHLPIAGYYSYSPPYGGDEVGFPLLDDSMFERELILPHYAGQGKYFWTGICLFNPNDISTRVVIAPHDNAGTVIENADTVITIEPGFRKVFTVRSMFGDLADDVAFIKFISEEGLDAPIGGFYMFGNMKNGKPSVEMISGANL